MKTKIPPPIVAIISILLTYLSKDYLGFFYLHPHLQKTLFILFLVSGILLIFFANREFRILETTVNPMKPKNATNLVNKGVFKFTRNPMYLGLFLILISFACLLYTSPSPRDATLSRMPSSA